MCGNEIRGEEILTKEFSRPIYVSPGHKISLETSLKVVRETIKPPHKLPEPIHIAKKISRKAKSNA